MEAVFQKIGAKNEKAKIFGITDIALVLVSAVFLLGILFVFSPCGPTETGGWMSCHWAGNAVTGLAIVLTVLSLTHPALGDG